MYLDNIGIITPEAPSSGDTIDDKYYILQYVLRVTFKNSFVSTDNTFSISSPSEEVFDCIVPYSGIIYGDGDMNSPDIVGSVHKTSDFCQDGKLVKTSIKAFESQVSEVGFIKGNFFATSKMGNFFRLDFKENAATLWCENKNNKYPQQPKLRFTNRFYRVEYTFSPKLIINVPRNKQQQSQQQQQQRLLQPQTPSQPGPQPQQPQQSPPQIPRKKQSSQQKEQKPAQKQAPQPQQPPPQPPPQMKSQYPQYPIQQIKSFPIGPPQQPQPPKVITPTYIQSSGPQFGMPIQQQMIMQQPSQQIQQFTYQQGLWQQPGYGAMPVMQYNTVNTTNMQPTGQNTPIQFFQFNRNT